MHEFLFYNKFIIFLYMFRALYAHHQEAKLYYTASGIITLCRWPSSLNLCTVRPPTECDDAICYIIQCVPLATEPDISLIILPLMRILQRNLKTTDTFLFSSHTSNVLLFKFRCNIFIGVRIIKEMPGSVASGTPCIILNTNAGPLHSKLNCAV